MKLSPYPLMIMGFVLFLLGSYEEWHNRLESTATYSSAGIVLIAFAFSVIIGDAKDKDK